MMVASGIYVILNTANNKVYVGKAADISGRWKVHKSLLKSGSHHNKHLQHAWNKYSAKAFRFRVLEYCPVDKLDEREKHFIAIYKTRGMSYNFTDGGEGSSGRILSEETKRKIGAKSKGRTSMKGRHHTEESRRKMSLSQKGNTNSLGKVRTEEHKLNLSNALKGKTPHNKGKPMSEEQKAKLRKPKTEEHKKRLSEAAKLREAQKRALKQQTSQ